MHDSNTHWKLHHIDKGGNFYNKANLHIVRHEKQLIIRNLKMAFSYHFKIPNSKSNHSNYAANETYNLNKYIFIEDSIAP